MKLFVEEDLQLYRQADPRDEDVFETLSRYRAQLPPLRFDCGTDDELVGYSRQLHQQLSAAGILHQYQEFEGGHQWEYWERHLKDSLLFFAESLRSE